MPTEKIFRVSVRRLNLRAQPANDAGILAKLAAGQAVVRLDDVDRAGWWFVFADTPGDGIFVGHVWAEFLSPAFALQTDFPGDAIMPGSPPLLDEWDMPEPDPEDDDASPPREPVGGGALIDSDDTTDGAEAEAPAWTSGWNPDVSAERRHVNGAHGARRSNGTIDQVIIHITGTQDLAAVVNTFTKSPGLASAHYLVCPDGAVHQFVAEDQRAFHSGIIKAVRKLYNRGDGSWRQYKRYFSWHKGYPKDAIYLDAAGQVVAPSQRQTSAVLVVPADRSEWPDFQYFDRRWGRLPKPFGYLSDNHDPNNNSIGIEVLSVGARTASSQAYSDEMYSALGALVGDICRRHQLPIQFGTVCGHEDVNPVERWGWDPNQGFDWDKLLRLARLKDHAA